MGSRGQLPRIRVIGLRLCLLLLLALGSFVPGNALGKGGTNMHEMLSTSRPAAPNYDPSLPSEGFVGCGRGRYCDARTHKCRGRLILANETIDRTR
jgi:hypothetical protein